MKNFTKKFIAITVAFTFVLGGIALSPSFTDAFGPRISLTDEQKAAMKEAARNGDFEKLRELMSESGFGKRSEQRAMNVRSSLTDDQKEALREAHQSGNKDQVKELLTEYGIKKGPRSHMRMTGDHKMMMRHEGMSANLTDEQRTAMREAHESGDCEAMIALHKESGMEGPMSELSDEQHLALCQAHQSGDHEAAESLMEEYGVEHEGGKHMGMMGNHKMGEGMGMHRGERSGRSMGRHGNQEGGSMKHSSIYNSIENIAPSDLSEVEEEFLIAGQQEERMARDVYRALAEMYPEVRVFGNIARSEDKHINAIGTLLDRYELGQTTGYGEFESLYSELITKGELSLEDALEVGVTIETVDIDDLDETLEATDNEDIKAVFGNLKKASLKHLSAFVRTLHSYEYETDIDWESYISQDDLEHTGGRGGRNTGGRWMQ